MKILVLGHNGYLGSRLFANLKQRGHEVWGLMRDTDLRYSCLCHADLVVNCAGKTKDESKMVRDNLLFAIEVARNCAAFKKRLIHVGSIYETRKDKGLYALTKFAASEAILQMKAAQNLDAIIVRPVPIYGGKEPTGSMLRAMWGCYKNDETFQCVENGAGWLHVDDFCEAISALAEKQVWIRSVVDLAPNEATLNRDIVERFRARVGTIKSINIGIDCGKIVNLDPSQMLAEAGWSPKTPVLAGMERAMMDLWFEEDNG